MGVEEQGDARPGFGRGSHRTMATSPSHAGLAYIVRHASFNVMSARRIHLGSEEIAYRLTRSARRRTIGLKVGEDGLTVVLPERLRAGEADRAVREKAHWVLDRLRRVRERPTRPALQGRDGATVGYLGRALTLTVTPHAPARTRIQRSARRLAVFVDARLDGALRAATVIRALRRWRREEAERLFTPKIEAFAEALGLAAPRVLIREQKARWGSCSSDGVIRLNARLVAYEDGLIDYVCAHEACHLVEMNHGPGFHALLEGLIADHRDRSRALRETFPPGAAF